MHIFALLDPVKLIFSFDYSNTSLKKGAFAVLLLGICIAGIAQSVSCQRFHFDEGEIHPGVKFVGVSKAEDRFGNLNSAIYLHGNNTSYVNLGTGDELKPANGTVSIWFKMDNCVYSGRGYESNPLIITKCQKGYDFNEAYSLGYDWNAKLIYYNATFSEEKQLSVRTMEKLTMRTWHHAVLTYDSASFNAYYDGKKVISIKKDFATRFLQGDSVMLGHSASSKNLRFFNGAIDDVDIYPYVLTEQEVLDLYMAPDPKKKDNVLFWIAVVFAGLVILALVVYLVVRSILKKEKQKNLEKIRAFDYELRALKAQMNPHFIFNSFNTLQGFIMRDKPDTALLYLNKFSRLLRKILDGNASDDVTIADEIEILTFYIEIESMRFDNKLAYQIVIDEKIDKEKDCIPHFLLQPFVENALWHGLSMKEGEKMLHLEFLKGPGATVYCVIEDNGIGREAAKRHDNNKVKESLAIHLTKQRLELMSRKDGCSYTLEIIDKYDTEGKSAGTKVILKIPITRK